MKRDHALLSLRGHQISSSRSCSSHQAQGVSASSCPPRCCAQLSSVRPRAKQTQLLRPMLNSRLFNLTVTSKVVIGHNLYYLLVSTSSEGEFTIQQHHSPTCYTASRIPINIFLTATVKSDSSSSIVKENMEILTPPKLTDNIWTVALSCCASLLLCQYHLLSNIDHSFYFLPKLFCPSTFLTFVRVLLRCVSAWNISHTILK